MEGWLCGHYPPHESDVLSLSTGREPVVDGAMLVVAVEACKSRCPSGECEPPAGSRRSAPPTGRNQVVPFLSRRYSGLRGCVQGRGNSWRSFLGFAAFSQEALTLRGREAQVFDVGCGALT